MFKNLTTTLLRFRSASALNILGLSVAYAAFLLIFMQVRYEYSYGNDDPNSHRIYRIETAGGQGEWRTGVDANITAYLAQNESSIEALVAYDTPTSNLFVAATDDVDPSLSADMVQMQHDITRVFHFDMVEGVAPDIDAGDQTMIPQSLARSLFAKESAVGRTLYCTISSTEWRETHKMQKQIVGVYRDFDRSSTLANAIYTPFKRLGEYAESSYVLLRAGADTAQVLSSFRRNFSAKVTDSSDEIRLTRVDQTYFLSDLDRWSRTPATNGQKTTTDLLMAICLLIVLIALINYINFCTALAPRRLRGLNVRMVVGVTRGRLRTMLIVESLGMALLSYVVALLIVGTLNETSVVRLLHIPDSLLLHNIPAVLMGGALAAVMGIVAGIYPAYSSTRFEPSMVLKGGDGLSPRGRWLRMGLIGFQYVISMTLIITALFISLQNQYLRTTPMGFNTHNVVQFHMGLDDGDLTSHRLFKEQLLRNPAIEAVTFTRGKLGQGFTTSVPLTPMGSSDPDQSFDLKLDAVEPDFLDVMGVPIIAGRNFRADDMIENLTWYQVAGGNTERPPAVIVTRTAQRMGNITIDSLIDRRFRVVGVCEDLHYSSLHEAIGPFGFVVSPNNWRCYVRINPTLATRSASATEAEAMETVISYIRTEFDKIENSSVKFSCTMLDEALSAQYVVERDLGLMITLFSILAIIISLVGVFGLVLFESQYRRREIGLRKVHGASVAQIIAMFGCSFVVLVGVCFVIAAPVAWWAVDRWLEAFAYRTPIYWWVFAVSLLVVLAITILTVLIQSWRSATANPVESLKSE